MKPAHLSDGSSQLILSDRFEQIVDGGKFYGTHEIISLSIGGGEDNIRQRDGLLHLLEQLHGIPSLQLDIKEKEIGLKPQDALQGAVIIVATVYHLHLLVKTFQFF